MAFSIRIIGCILVGISCQNLLDTVLCIAGLAIFGVGVMLEKGTDESK